MDAREITLHFKVTVTKNNINSLKRLHERTNMIEEDEIEVGEEVTLNYTLQGELSENAVSMAMLFNGDLTGKPFIRLGRGEEVEDFNIL